MNQALQVRQAGWLADAEAASADPEAFDDADAAELPFDDWAPDDWDDTAALVTLRGGRALDDEHVD